nr:MAG TPA: hypothetical protein [Caudoviricetes sp.]
MIAIFENWFQLPVFIISLSSFTIGFIKICLKSGYCQSI